MYYTKEINYQKIFNNCYLSDTVSAKKSLEALSINLFYLFFKVHKILLGETVSNE